MTDVRAVDRRAHLLRTLQDFGRPMTTTELVNSCPPEISRYDTPCPCRTSRDRDLVVNCHHGWYEVQMAPSGSNVYANLRQLEKLGYVEAIKTPGVKMMCWQSVLTADEQATFDAIVAADAEWGEHHG